MSEIPKHKPTRRTPKPKQAQAAAENITKVVVTGPNTNHMPSPSMQHDINHVAGLGDVATHLDWIGDAVARLTNDDDTVGVAVCQNSYGVSIQIALAMRRTPTRWTDW